jgi:DNA-directed RNA polymerase subunit RPC12/RpoP
MKEKILCDNCNKSIDYECYDYHETEQEEEIEEIECPHCKTKLSVSWYATHNFQTTIKNEE